MKLSYYPEKKPVYVDAIDLQEFRQEMESKYEGLEKQIKKLENEIKNLKKKPRAKKTDEN